MPDRPDDYRDWLADSIEDDDRLEGYDYETVIPSDVPLLYVDASDASNPLKQTLWAVISPDNHRALIEPQAPPELPVVLDELGLDAEPTLKEVS